MKLMLRAKAKTLSKKITLISTAFVLAVSTLTAATPFVLAENASAVGDVHTTDLSTWNRSETRATGHNELVPNGLHVWTEGATSTDKAAGYYATPGLSLSEVNSASIEFASGWTGGRPGIQLGVDYNNDGVLDGNLVSEAWVGGYGGDNWWTNKPGFGVSNKGFVDYQSVGTLAEYQAANPNAKILAIGYSLGSGVKGDVVITKITIGNVNYTFSAAPPAAPTNLRLNGDKLCGFTTGVNYITPTWNAVVDAVSYNYQVTLPNGSVYGPVNVGNVTSVSGSFGAEGTSTFSVQAVNALGQTSAWSNACAVTYDATAPVVTGISQAYEIQQNGRIAVTLTFSEAIDPTSMGQGWSAVAGSGTTKFIKRYYSTSDQTIAFKDVAGNQGTYSFTVDMSVPTGTLSYSPSTLTNGAVIVTLNTNEPIKQSSLPGTWLKKSETQYQKSYPVDVSQTVTLEDLTGNKTTVTVFIDWIDKTLPTVTLKTGASETIGSGPYKKVSYKLFDANKVDKAQVNDTIIELNDNTYSDLNNIAVGSMGGKLGTNTVKVWDAAGNVTEFTVELDNVAPTATFTYSNNNGAALTNSDVTVTLVTSEPIQTPSGWTSVDAQNFTRTYANNGKNALTITDLAGNTKTSEFEVKRIDRNAPTIAGVSAATVKGAVTLTILDPKYEGYDGFDTTQGLKVNGNSVVTSYDSATKTYSYTIQGDGEYTVVATDKAGNPTTLEFTIDNSVKTTVEDIDLTTTTPTISGTLSYTADDLPVALAALVLVVDGNEGDPYNVTTDVDGKWEVPVLVGNGSHIVSVRTVNGESTSEVATKTFLTTLPVVVSPPAPQPGDNNPDDGDDNQTDAAGAGTQGISGPTPQITNPANNFAAILGTESAASNNQAAQSGAVEGASTERNLAQAVDTDSSDGTVFGLAWYWWLLILAALATIIWWIIAALRRRREEA